MESNTNQIKPIETPDDFPPRPRSKRPPLWAQIPGWIAAGFIPALLFLMLLLLESFGQKWTSAIDSKTETSLLYYGVAVFVLGTPVVLVPWSYFVLNATHGPILDDKRKLAWRIILIVLVSLEMSVANYVVGIVGVVLAAVVYVLKNGLPVVG